MKVPALPRLMVAPNGARRSRADHPALPVTVEQTVAAAVHCHRAGADGVHAHVRDEHGKHALDAGLYKELIAELATQAPELNVQITTEAVGIYTPAQQRQLVMDVQPSHVSVSLTEMMADDDTAAAQGFYQHCFESGIAVQHILYGAKEISRLAQLIAAGVIPAEQLQLLFVLGRYSENQQSRAEDLLPFLSQLSQSELSADWGLCAFGQAETDCLVAAARAGGKMRIGFENSLWHRDGSVAADNTDRVRELVSALQ